MAGKQKKKKRPGAWIDRISGSVGKFVRLETTDGLLREGRLSGLRFRTMEVDGVDQDVLLSLEMNNDSTDVIDFHIIGKIDID